MVGCTITGCLGCNDANGFWWPPVSYTVGNYKLLCINYSSTFVLFGVLLIFRSLYRSWSQRLHFSQFCSALLAISTAVAKGYRFSAASARQVVLRRRGVPPHAVYSTAAAGGRVQVRRIAQGHARFHGRVVCGRVITYSIYYFVYEITFI